MDTITPPRGIRPKRFMQGARERFSGWFYDKSVTMTTSQQTLDFADLPAGDYTAGIWLWITCTTAANAATVAFRGDGPFSAIQQVELQDPQGNSFQIASGYELSLINALGGFTGQGDATKGPNYSATTGAGATGGSFGFMLRVPAEFFPREGMGALFNGATNSQFRVRLNLAPSTDVYSTAPTTLGTVRVRMATHGYVVPYANAGGNNYPTVPPGGAVFNAWNRQVWTIGGAGNQTADITIGKGQFWRQAILIFRDNSTPAVRSSSILSGDLVARVDNVDVFSGTQELLRQVTWERNRYTDAANLPTGVGQLSWCHEWDGVVGGETRDFWVPTQTGSICQLRFTAGAAGSLTLLLNSAAVTDEAIESGLTP